MKALFIGGTGNISPLFLLDARVEADNDLTQVGLVQMGIDLGGGEGSMAEHELDRSQVGSVLHQVGGKRMANDVRADLRSDAGRQGVAVLAVGGEHGVVGRQGAHHPRGDRLLADVEVEEAADLLELVHDHLITPGLIPPKIEPGT